jgi:hypothetical protein
VKTFPGARQRGPQFGLHSSVPTGQPVAQSSGPHLVPGRQNDAHYFADIRGPFHPCRGPRPNFLWPERQRGAKFSPAGEAGHTEFWP